MIASLHMEPGALWGKNAHTKTTAPVVVSGVKDYVSFFVPRTVFRRAASTFSDFRQTDSNARYEEISMQLFLQMVHDTANLPEEQQPAGDCYPYVKAWLEWVPSAVLKDTAVGYTVHAVSLHKDVKFGNALRKILFENNMIHADSINRKMNSRKSDPLSGLHPYQKWMRVNGLEMYIRTICDRYDNSQNFTSRMDVLLNPKISVDKPGNQANPSNVFTIGRAIQRLPDSTPEDFTDVLSYVDDPQNITTLQFPSSEHLQLLTPQQLHPKTFCSKYLPDFQTWMEQQKAIPQKLLETDYDQNVDTEYDIRTPADIERARLEGLADRSAFTTLSIQSKAKYVEDCIEHEQSDAFPEVYERFQHWAVNAMEKQCLDADAHVSEVVSKMLSWRSTHQEASVIKHRLIDPSMSVFANRVISLMEGYEQYYLISTAHRMMFLIHHARYDAFRRDFGLHFNCFQAGDGACSKSFLFLLNDQQSIPGTMDTLTYQTGKADAIDGNRNDVCTVCHEAPPGMFRTAKNPNADSTQEAMFKEKLTSQRVTAKIWCQDESTGKRTSRVTQSECIGVWMGATNDPPADVEEALKTRFFWGNFEQQKRRGRDIDDCMNGERMMSSADKAHRKRLFRESQEEQFRVMIVEKAIWAKVIKGVNTTAYNIVIPRLKSNLTKNSIISPGPRDWERVKIFARCMAIVTAIERVCNLPSGAHYGMPFDASALPKLEPYLRVTEEMVIFAVSLLADQFRSPIEHKILNTIGTMERNAPTFKNPNSDETCFDYIKLPKLRQLSKKINSRIPLEKGRTSTHNIENFILLMTRHSIFSRPYKQRTVPIGSQAAANQFPEPDTNKSRQQYLSAIVTNDGVYIHTSHVLAHSEDNSDSIFQTLANETHQYSAEKRMLTACPVSPEWFHVFRVIDRKPAGTALRYKNVLANSAISRWMTRTSEADAETRTRSGFTINKDIDLYVAEKWAGITGKATETPFESVQSIVDSELGEYDRPDIYYPDCFHAPEEEPVTGKRLHEDDEDTGPSKRLHTA